MRNREQSILILGDGLLGSELRRQTGWDYASRKKDGIDFTNYSYITKIYPYNVVVNCIANTDTYSDNQRDMWETNYMGVVRLVDYCNDRQIKVVQISTDYIYAGSVPNAKETDVPVCAGNYYSYTKLLADAYAQGSEKNLIIRTSFKPRPFPHSRAVSILTGNFDYVDVIASLIIELITREATGIYNVGTKKKTMYELAKQTKPDVEAYPFILNPSMPVDVSMDISKMRNFLGIKDE